MPRGAPDDSDVRKEGITVRIDDMGELAVRMGSSMNYHRGGELTFLDTFEAGLAELWIGALVADASVVLTSTYACSSGVSVRCDTGVLINNGVELAWKLSPIETELVGFHIAFSTEDANAILRFRVLVNHPDTSYAFEVGYDYTTGIVTYDEGSWPHPSFTTHGTLWVGGRVFHHLKMIVHYDIPFYHKLFLDGESYDMAGYECEERSPGYDPGLRFGLYVQVPTGIQSIVYVDDVIITQNEV